MMRTRNSRRRVDSGQLTDVSAPEASNASAIAGTTTTDNHRGSEPENLRTGEWGPEELTLVFNSLAEHSWPQDVLGPSASPLISSVAQALRRPIDMVRLALGACSAFVQQKRQLSRPEGSAAPVVTAESFVSAYQTSVSRVKQPADVEVANAASTSPAAQAQAPQRAKRRRKNSQATPVRRTFPGDDRGVRRGVRGEVTAAGAAHVRSKRKSRKPVSRTDARPVVAPEVAERLRGSVRGRAALSLANAAGGSHSFKRWCVYNWFCSDMDRAFFDEPVFMHSLQRLGTQGISVPDNQAQRVIDASNQMSSDDDNDGDDGVEGCSQGNSVQQRDRRGMFLTCREWSVLRRAMGRPRRFSSKFVAEQRRALERHRSTWRKLHSGPGDTAAVGDERAGALADVRSVGSVRNGSELPNAGRVECEFDVGDRVTALHPQAMELAAGRVIAICPLGWVDQQQQQRHNGTSTSIKKSSNKSTKGTRGNAMTSKELPAKANVRKVVVHFDFAPFGTVACCDFWVCRHDHPAVPNDETMVEGRSISSLLPALAPPFSLEFEFARRNDSLGGASLLGTADDARGAEAATPPHEAVDDRPCQSGSEVAMNATTISLSNSIPPRDHQRLVRDSLTSLPRLDATVENPSGNLLRSHCEIHSIARVTRLLDLKSMLRRQLCQATRVAAMTTMPTTTTTSAAEAEAMDTETMVPVSRSDDNGDIWEAVDDDDSECPSECEKAGMCICLPAPAVVARNDVVWCLARLRQVEFELSTALSEMNRDACHVGEGSDPGVRDVDRDGAQPESRVRGASVMADGSEAPCDESCIERVAENDPSAHDEWLGANANAAATGAATAATIDCADVDADDDVDDQRTQHQQEPNVVEQLDNPEHSPILACSQRQSCDAFVIAQTDARSFARRWRTLGSQLVSQLAAREHSATMAMSSRTPSLLRRDQVGRGEDGDGLRSESDESTLGRGVGDLVGALEAADPLDNSCHAVEACASLLLAIRHCSEAHMPVRAISQRLDALVDGLSVEWASNKALLGQVRAAMALVKAACVPSEPVPGTEVFE